MILSLRTQNGKNIIFIQKFCQFIPLLRGWEKRASMVLLIGRDPLGVVLTKMTPFQSRQG